MSQQLERVREHVKQNIQKAVAELNRELELAEVLMLPVAIKAENNVNIPCRVQAIFLENMLKEEKEEL